MKIDTKDMLKSILNSLSRIEHIKPEDIPNIDLYMDLLLPFAILPEADQSIFLSSAFSHKRQSSTYR